MIRLNIAGAFAKHNEIKLFLHQMPDIFKFCKITVYDGIRDCSWNGGRINRGVYDRDDIAEFYYDHDISVALTLTNPVIDINDAKGNDILKKYHRENNTIISVNDNFLQYIKNKFPLYKHTKSITSFGKIDVPMSDKDFEKYSNLEKIYDYIVPRCEHVFDKRFELLTQSKYEVMLNDTCVYKCPYYGEHFKKIAEQNRKFDTPWSEKNIGAMKNIEECWLSTKSTMKSPVFFSPEDTENQLRDKLGDDYGMDLTTNQISNLIERGVQSFKLTGREMNSRDFIAELHTYGSGIINAIRDK